MFPVTLLQRSERLLEACQARGIRLALAESCTGGLIAACLTEIAGSSATLERGFVTYSNEAKQELIGVPEAMIREQGAVSAQVAAAMAEGALDHSHADLSLSVTGIAGPGGATERKPVGLVYFGTARRNRPAHTQERRFSGDRHSVRLAAVETGLGLLEAELEA